jgi:putative acetyltransferase
MPKMVNVRPETINDLGRSNEIIVSAFKDHPYSNQKEHLLVAGLRSQGVLDVSLVAEFEGKIVGHIALSFRSRIPSGDVVYHKVFAEIS